jgi:hypothetical protein
MRFKPEDFDVDQRDASLIDIAHQANEKLKRLIESWPVVYRDFSSGDLAWYYASFRRETATHKARLAFIEEIPKEPCKHEAQIFRNTWNDTGPRYILDADKTVCAKCGVELTATWSAK